MGDINVNTLKDLDKAEKVSRKLIKIDCQHHNCTLTACILKRKNVEII